MIVAELVYLSCAFASLLCAWLLFRGYRRSRVNLLFWTALCFLGFTVNNLVLFADTAIYPNLNMSIFRLIPAVLGVSALLYGLVQDSR